MITLQHSTRPKAIMRLVIGGLVLVASAVFHQKIFPQAGSLGYLVGGGLILVGIWTWFSAVHEEKATQVAEQRGRMTAAEHAVTGIPDTKSAPGGILTFVAIGLVVFGVLLFPAGLLLAAGGAALWWHARKMQAARAAQGEARFFPHLPAAVIGGELRGEIRLPGGVQPSGPARVSLACRRHILVEQAKGPDRLDTDSLGESVQRLVGPEAWQPGANGLTAAIVLPVRGGAPSAGSVPVVRRGQPSVVWYLLVTLPVNGREQTMEFIVPVSGQAEPQPSEIPPEMVAAASDILAPGNPGKVAEFLADKAVETREVAGVVSADVAAILAAAGIREVPKHGALGGHGLQMDPDACQAAQRFMNAGVGCALFIYAGLGFVALFLLLIPYVGWLFTLAVFGFIAWAVRGTLADKAKINRSPELLWAEPGHLCYMPDGATEWRVPLAELERVELQWIGGAGDNKYMKISVAKAPSGGAAKRERILLAHGVCGTEAARAVVTWLLQKLGASLPVVEAQQGQDQLEKMRDWVKDPTKR